MIIVSPYRPFAPESVTHRYLGPFDWIAALRMLDVSTRRNCAVPTLALTDVDTNLPVPSVKVVTTERRLMLWVLDVCLQYLQSPWFDDDTVMISPDSLVLKDLRPYAYRGDLGIVVRSAPKYARRPILNGLQFWSLAAKDKLVAFYAKALSLAREMPSSVIVWGADTEPIFDLISPIAIGVADRAGLSVHQIDSRGVLESYNPARYPTSSVVDFRNLRKQHMAQAFDQFFGAVLA